MVLPGAFCRRPRNRRCAVCSITATAGKHLADPLRQFGMLRDVLVHRRMFAAASGAGKIVRQRGEQILVGRSGSASTLGGARGSCAGSLMAATP